MRNLISAALVADLKKTLNVTLESDVTPGDTSADFGPEVGVYTVADVIEFDEAKDSIVEAIKEADESERDLSVLSESGDKVDALVASTEALIGRGETLSLEQAQIIIMRSHAAMTAVGLEELSEHSTLSLEQFGADKDRVTVTQEALDGLKARAGVIGTAVKDAVMRVITFIGNLITNLLKNTKALKSRATALTQRAEKLTGETGEMPGYNTKVLQWEGKSTADSIKTGLEKSAANYKALVAGSVKATEAFDTYLKESKVSVSSENITTILSSSIGSHSFMGGVTVSVVADKVVVASGKESPKADTSVPAPGKIKGVALAAISVIEALDSEKESLGKLKKINQELAKVAGETGGMAGLRIKLVSKLMRGNVSYSAAKVAGMLYTTAATALAYGEKACAQYKAKA